MRIRNAFRNRQLITITVIAIVATCGIAFATVHAARIERQLHAWKLLPQPERLTELYVSDRHGLKLDYTPGQELPVVFTIANHEGMERGYIYTLSLSSTGHDTTQLHKDVVTIANDQQKTIRIPITIPDNGPTVRLHIALADGQEINYRLQRQAK